MGNPYLVGDPVDGPDFYGRDRIASEILEGRSRVVHLIGMRRIGKTSLMRRLESRAASLFVNLQPVSGDMARLATNLNREVRRKREHLRWLPSNGEARDPFEILESIDEAAGHAGVTLYLLCDEAEGLIDFSEDALKRLKEFIWETSRSTRVVFASAKNLVELDDKCRAWKTSPFLNNFPPPVFLGSLSDNEANALITLVQSRTPVQATPALRADICFLTANHPYLIQWLCFRLWQEGNKLRPLAKDDRQPDSIMARRFQMDFDYLSDSERSILHIVSQREPIDRAGLESELGIPYLADYLDGMAQLGYLRRTPEGYAVGNAYLERWLKVDARWNTPSSILDDSTLAIYRKKENPSASAGKFQTQGWDVLHESAQFLFERTGELLKGRKGHTEAKLAPSVQLTASQPITSAVALLDVLRRKVELVERENATQSEMVDFVLVTALEEERDAVLEQLPGFQKLPPSKEDIRTYFRAELPVTFPDGQSGVYRVIVMPLLGMGRVQAAMATADAIRRWHPRYLILVGIAGGIAERGIGIGDILISDQIVDYELGKITPAGQEIRWEAHRADPRLLNACKNFMDRSWQKQIQAKRPDPAEPRSHIGPIASGDKVIAFGEILARYREVWPKLIGVEMEAAGVATAAFQSSEKPGFFMVRCVSDLADEQKGSATVEQWRPYACEAAAAFAVALLKSGPVLSSGNVAANTAEQSLRKVESLLTQLKDHADAMNRLRGQAVTIEIEENIDRQQEQIAQKSIELRDQFQRLAGQPIRVEALEGEAERAP